MCDLSSNPPQKGNRRYGVLLLVGVVVVFGLAACGGGGSEAPVNTPAKTNSVPLAVAGSNQSVFTGVQVTLDGSASSDQDGNPLSYSWSLTNKPAGSSASISSATSLTAYLTPDLTGNYIVQLIVSDGTIASVEDTLTVTASAASVLRPLPDTGQVTSYTNTFGEDHDYLINSPSYTVHGNGTVTDNVNGLMWQREDDDITRTWESATVYCDNLVLADYADWRLPTRSELTGIYDYGRVNPAIDPVAFPGTDSDYWSSETLVAYPNSAWAVEFFTSSHTDGKKNNNLYARCVRIGQ